MGAEREDTDPTAKRTGTEPGLGKGSGATPAAAPKAPIVEEEAPPPVDFDALHAALGDPLDYVEMGSGPALEKGNETDDLLDGLEAATAEAATGPGVRIGESSGRSSATYASARPHTIPPTRAPIEDPNAPAVIVATDTDTVPTAPPQMTVPLAASPHAAQFAGAHGAPHPAHAPPPGSNPHLGAALGSGPHPASPHPGSGPHAASAAHAGPGAHGGLGVSYPHTPQPIPITPRGGPQMTMRMPDRPVNARRGKTPTIVVRPRGPSTKQRLFAFMAMLLLVTACGIAVIIWRKPKWLGLDTLNGLPSWANPTAPAVPTTSAAPPVAPSSGALGAPSGSAAGATGTSATNGAGPTTAAGPNGSAGTASSAAAAGAASAAAAASASAKKGVKVAPPPTTSPAPTHSSGTATPSGHL